MVGWIGDGYNCTVEDKNSLEPGMLGLGIFSDIIAIFGSLFIIVTYFIFTDLKTRARKFLLIIALADFLNASTFLFGQIWSLVNRNFSTCYLGKPQYEIWFCVFSGAANNFFSLSCFTFTIFLGVHVIFLLFGSTVLVRRKAFVSSLIIGFAVPFIVTSITFWFGMFGPGNSATVGTCFIKNFNDTDDRNYQILFQLLSWYIWGILTDIFIFVIYIFAVCLMCKRRFQKEPRLASLLSEQDLKLLFIPVAFLFIRIWGDLHLLFLYKRAVSPVFLYLQAFFEPGQGWANFIIFVLLTKAVRDRVCVCFNRKPVYKTVTVEEVYSSYDRPMSDLSGSQVAENHPYELYKD